MGNPHFADPCEVAVHYVGLYGSDAPAQLAEAARNTAIFLALCRRCPCVAEHRKSFEESLAVITKARRLVRLAADKVRDPYKDD